MLYKKEVLQFFRRPHDLKDIEHWNLIILGQISFFMK